MVVFACPSDPLDRLAVHGLPYGALSFEAPPERVLASRGVRLFPGEAPAPQLTLALLDPARKAA